MNNRITQSELVTELSQAKALTKKDSERFMDLFFSLVEEYVIRDKVVKIKGLGTFKLVDVNERESVNVNTGERIVIAGHSKLTFTPDNSLKEQVNRPFAEFETVVLSDNVDITEMERIDESKQQSEPVEIESVQEKNSEQVTTEQLESVIESEQPVLEPLQPSQNQVKSIQEPLQPVQNQAEQVSKSDSASSTSAESLAAAKAAAAAAEAAAKAAAAVAEAAAKAAPQISQTQSTQPQISQPQKKGTLHAWIWGVVTIVLMVISYIAGYRQVIPMPKHSEAVKTENVQKQKVAEPVSRHQSKPSKPSVEKPTPKHEPAPEELAANYPQVEGGDYLIVGELDHVHKMKVGETLYKIAGKELGSQKLMQYIMVFNRYPEDVVIFPDQPIRLPKLVKKTK